MGTGAWARVAAADLSESAAFAEPRCAERVDIGIGIGAMGAGP